LKHNGEIFPEFFKSCPNLAPLRTPIALTQKLWQNTSYLQPGGLINWFCVVITIFAQHLNICSPNLGIWRRCLPPHGSYWWLWDFAPFAAIVTRRQLTLATKTNLAWLAKPATDRKMLAHWLLDHFAYII